MLQDLRSAASSGDAPLALFVSPIPLFPTDGGNRARMATMMDALRRRGYRIGFVLLWSRQLEHMDEAAHRAAFGNGFHFLKRGRTGNLGYLASRAIRTAKRHLQGRLGYAVPGLGSVDETFYTPYLGALRRIMARDVPALALVQYASSSKALEACPAGTMRILDTHDSFAHVYAPAEERRAFLRAEAVIAIQEEEAHAFRALLGVEHARVHVVGHLINEEAPVAPDPAGGATFVGSSFTANIRSLRWFIDAVLPLIRRQMPDFTLTVAGSICRDVPDGPGIRKLGRVGHLREAFVGAPILINPITEGTGLKIKLIDALALGVPAISTALGVRGIDPALLGGIVCVPDGDAPAFAEGVLRVLGDHAFRRELGTAMRQAACHWRERQEDALCRIVAPARRGAGAAA